MVRSAVSQKKISSGWINRTLEAEETAFLTLFRHARDVPHPLPTRRRKLKNQVQFHLQKMIRTWIIRLSFSLSKWLAVLERNDGSNFIRIRSYQISPFCDQSSTSLWCHFPPCLESNFRGVNSRFCFRDTTTGNFRYYFCVGRIRYFEDRSGLE